MAFALRSTAKTDKVLSFYTMFAAAHWTNKARVTGTPDEWDRVLQSYEEGRKWILGVSRLHITERQASLLGSEHFLIKTVDAVTPAKRDAEGNPVQKVVVGKYPIKDEVT